MSDKVKVAVRVRPFNRREVELGTKCVLEMEDQQTTLYHPASSSPVGSFREKLACKEAAESLQQKKSPKTFAFDHCFWSIDEKQSHYASQESVFQLLGTDILERAFEGYNACIFAYGQTGSGKSYTMMGTQDQLGIIPRLCGQLFDQINKFATPDTVHKVEVSYMEIYNEKVRDLLDPKGGNHNLRVREHNILGPYVDGLSTLAVSNFEDIDALMSEGNKSRTVAATNMNSESSRSHAVFSIILTQTLSDSMTEVTGEKVSKMSLVDLAGSERAQKTGAVGDRLKEGSNINKSLTTLGLVISALADGGKSKTKFVPYRDSVLTWLLKDNLGGNSKTVMVATVSPAADNYEETLSTLRYADRAKKIVNHAVVNEDPNARIIRELREEVEMLRAMLDEAQNKQGAPHMRERLHESEKLMKEMSKTWEEKVQETEKIHAERHAALEKMGISVQTSGIKVETGKYYLVNLNADPSLDSLLVYYLKEYTLVGRSDAPIEQDIQLSGLGILPEHCIIECKDEVVITPKEAARVCVNGKAITEATKVKNGDRILWGNNHFFRINCPRTNSPSAEQTPDNVDYDYAQQELLMESGDSCVQQAISNIEKQHETDKAKALAQQRRMYERQMQMLRSQLMSPSTPSKPFPPFFEARTPSSSSTSMHPQYQQWATERDKMFKASLSKLKEEVLKANSLVRETNLICEELHKDVELQVTLQIPAANLSPNRKRGAFVSEPAILVKMKNKGSQIWSLEKLENKMIDMREIYTDRENRNPTVQDPFLESQENHNLIGVANIFLEALFYNVKLEYHVPIISQQGEVAGRLNVELHRVDLTLPETDESAGSDDGVVAGATLVCRVGIKEAQGLPPALSHFVFCQYAFWGSNESTMVPPIVDTDINGLQRKRRNGMCFCFNHLKDFTVHVTEEFIEHCTEGALSIEVWGHRLSTTNHLPSTWEFEQVQAKAHSINDRWRELTRKLELWVSILELSEQGEYVPVELTSRADVLTGGVFQLRQGHSRRIQVHIKNKLDSGTLPIICESIQHVSIGGVAARSKLQKGLDSYQEEDLQMLRDKWSSALNKRKEYLDEQIQKIMSKIDKDDKDVEREKSLIDQWVCLTEERNAVLVPAAGSGIPGAPAAWSPPLGMEEHIPVIFLDLNADDMSTPGVKEGMQSPGMNSILPKEHGAKFFNLPLVKPMDEVGAIVSWDSSIHDSVHLNRVTPENERVYLILKVVVRLSHPAAMELILRKRLCINVYKRQSLTEKLKKRLGKAVMPNLGGGDYYRENPCHCGVAYEIVSNVPKASEDLEDRESLAQMAASQNEAMTDGGESYIETYIKGVSAVESILTLDKLRQEVAIKELCSRSNKQTNSTDLASSNTAIAGMRKATSVPNIHAMMLSSPRTPSDVEADRRRNARIEETSSSINMSGPLVTLVEESNSKLAASLAPLLNQNSDDSDGDEDFKKLHDFQALRREEEFSDFQSYQPGNDELKRKRPERPGSLFRPVSNPGDMTEHLKPPINDGDVVPFPGPESNSNYEMSQSLQLEVSNFKENGHSDKINVCTEKINSEVDNTNRMKLTIASHSNSSAQNLNEEVEALATPEREEQADYVKDLQDESSLLRKAIVDKPDMVRMRKSNSLDMGRAAAHRRSLPMRATYESDLLDLSGGSDQEDSLSICSFGSRADLHNLGVTPVPAWVQCGISVQVLSSRGGSKTGVVQFIGQTDFASGNWVGVDLDTPEGKNDGSVKGVRYFRCRSRHGVFVRHDKLILNKKRQPLSQKNSVSRRSTGNLSVGLSRPSASFMRATSASSARQK